MQRPSRIAFWIVGGAAIALLAALAAAPTQAAALPPGTGGPDAGNYRWIDHTVPLGPSTSWSAIAGTDITGSLSCDKTAGAIALPFAWNWYGVTTFTQVRVNENGWIAFGTPYSIPADANVNTYTPNPIPSGTVPNNYVAGLFVDVDVINGAALCSAATVGTVKYTTLGTAPNREFVVQWLNTPLFDSLVCAPPPCAAPATVSFQIRLQEYHSDIVVVIKDGSWHPCAPNAANACTGSAPITSTDEGTILGVEKDGTAGLQYWYRPQADNANVVLSTRAVAYYRNQAPTATGFTTTLNEDCSAVVSTSGCISPYFPITLTGSDPDGDTLQYCIVSGPTKGTLMTAPPACNTTTTSSAVTYKPNNDYCNGPAFSTTYDDSFTYKVSDGFLYGPAFSSAATVYLQVTCIGDAPIAVADAYTVFEDCSASPAVSCGALYLGVAPACATGLKCNDVERDDLQVPTPAPTHMSLDNAIVVAGPASGSLVKYDGTGASPTITADGSFRYRPNDNFCGSDAFTYKLQDDNSPSLGAAPPYYSNTVTAAITVTCVSDAPVGVLDFYSIPPTTTVSFPATAPVYPAAASTCPVPAGVLCNDYDNDAGESAGLQAVSWSAVTCGSGVGTLSGTGTGGGFTFTTPAAATSCTFTYVAKDAGGSTSAPTTVTIIVIDPYAANDALSATEDVLLSGAACAPNMPAVAGGPYAGVICNDFDFSNHPIQAFLVTGPGNTGGGGTFSLSATGAFTYRASTNFCGSDVFTYKIKDLSTGSFINTASATVAIACVNDAPAVPGAALVTSVLEDSATGTLTLTGSDPDNPPNVATNDQIAFCVVAAPTKNTVASGVPVCPSWSPFGTSSSTSATVPFSYKPLANFCGPDPFTYMVKDAAGLTSATRTVSLDVTCVADAPVANPETYFVAAGHALNTLTSFLPAVVANDVDADTPYGDTIQAVTPIVAPCSNVGTGTLLLNSNGHFTYTPPGSFVGTTTFSYKAKSVPDNLPSASCATVTLIVQPNKPPVASFSASTLSAKVGQVIAFVDTSVDPDAGGKVTTWSWVMGDGFTSSLKSVAHAFSAAGSYSVCLVAGDEWGDMSSPACQTVMVTASAGPAPPVPPSPPTGPDTGPTKSSPSSTAPATPPPPTADAGPDQTVPEKTAVVLAGTVTGAAPSCQWQQLQGPPVTLAQAATCSASFSAPGVGKKPAQLVFALIGSDGSQAATPDLVTVTVHSGNQAPQAAVGAASHATPGAVVTLDGSASSDPDGDLLAYTWTQRNGASAALSLPAGAQPTFTVPAGATGTLSFALEVSDGMASGLAVQDVIVDPAPPGPGGAAFARSVAPDGTVAVTPLLAGSAFAWDFGDGHTETTSGPTAHLFAKSGTYKVSLSVDGGAPAAQSVAVTVPAQPHSVASSAGGATGFPWAAVGLGAAAIVLAGTVLLLLLRRRP